MPWNANMGGPRPQIELAEEFSRQGHFVEKFDVNDAFPKPSGSKFINIRRNFALKAKAYVIKNAHRFDIIDAHHGTLPFSKEELRFNGLLVARSSGLYPLQYECLKELKKRWSGQNKGKLLGKLVRWRYNRRHLAYCFRSLAMADLTLVINRAELAYVDKVLNQGHKTQLVHNALLARQQTALEQAAQPARSRLANAQIVFIGAWTLNKGSQDWGEIVRKVRAKVLHAKFLFLGGGCPPEKVLADLGLPPCDWLKIVPFYENTELPTLLSDCTVGAFPSYTEGFGLAVLEKLSAGLPTVSYDIAGPTEMLGYLGADFMATRGDTTELSHRLVKLLELDEQSYVQLSQQCIHVARRFCWSELAPQTIKVYREFLTRC